MPTVVPSASRAELLRAYLAKLEASGIRAVVLHSYADLPGADDHDIDIATDSANFERALELQVDTAAEHGWVLVQSLRHELTASYRVLASLDDPRQSLKLDLCSHYMARGRRILGAAELTDQPGHSAGDIPIPIPIPEPRAEFGYLLAKAFIKAKASTAVLPRLAELYAADPEGCDAMTARLAPLPDFATLEKAANADSGFFASGRGEFYEKHPARAADVPREFLRRLRRFLRPTGAMLVVLGPDGAGKSTVINALETGLAPFFRRYRYLHFRPDFCGSETPETDSQAVTDPHGQAPRGLLTSWLKVAYYAADYLVSYLRVLRRQLAESTLIIFDRYYQDLLVDPRRFRLRGCGLLLKLLAPLIPKPMLYLVLDAEPEAIHARKPELPLEELTRQREIFRQFAQSERRAVIIPTGGDETETLTFALNTVVDRLAEREAKR